MNILSIIIILVGAGALIYGYQRGIVKEAVSLVSLLLGIVACRLFGAEAAAGAARLLGHDPEAGGLSHYADIVIGYGMLLVIVWVAVYFLGRMVRGVVRAVHLGLIERLAGSLYVCAKWMLIMSMALNLVYLIAPHASFWGSDPPSGIAEAVLAFGPWLLGALSAAAL